MSTEVTAFREYHRIIADEYCTDPTHYIAPEGKRTPSLGIMGYTIMDWLISQGHISWYSIVTVHNLGDKRVNAMAMRMLADRRLNIVFANTTDHLTIIRADGPISAAGLELWSATAVDADGNFVRIPSKLNKRTKIFARPGPLRTVRDELSVRVISDPELIHDGVSFMSQELWDEMVDNMVFKGWHPIQEAAIRRTAQGVRIANAVIVGKMRNKETQKLLEGMIKGQFIRTSNLGCDLVVFDHMIKPEITGGVAAFVTANPQEIKDARGDRQQFINQQATGSRPEFRETLKDESRVYFRRLIIADQLRTYEELVSQIFSTRFAFDADSLDTMLKRDVANFAAHGLDFTTSLYFTRQVAALLPKSWGVGSPRENKTLKVKLRCAVRTLVWAESTVNMFREFMNMESIIVRPGEVRFDETLRVGVIPDDEMNDFQDTHGGSDGDDFYVMRWVTYLGDRKVYITRNPNSRGAYSFHDYHTGDWYPTWERPSGKVISFPKLPSQPRWPTQILDAKRTGETAFIIFPSELKTPTLSQPIRYTPAHARADLASVAQGRQGTYGTSEILLSCWWSTDPAAHLPAMPNPETAIDIFTAGGDPDDKEALHRFNLIMEQEVRSIAHKVDPLLGARTGMDDEVTWARTGPYSELKKLMRKAASDYDTQVKRFIAGYKVPTWLVDLGRNEFYHMAVQLTRKYRLALHYAGIFNLEPEERGRATRAIANATFLPPIEAETDPARRAFLVLALWYVGVTLPTKVTQNLNDQHVMGSDVFEHLLDALCFFGIGHRPYVDETEGEEGTVKREAYINYAGNRTFEVVCRVGGEMTDTDMMGLMRYHAADGVCKVHRNIQADSV